MARLQRGQSPIQPTVTITDIRPLTRADISHLTVKRDGKTIQSLRDNHHRIARAVAGGLSNADVALTCGVSISRVASLRPDPAFIELVAHYRSLLTAEWVATADPVTEYMRANSLKAQAMISDKLDEAAEKNEFLPTRDLLGIAEFGADRTGYGKVNKNLNINVDFAAKLEEARTRSARALAIRTIEGQSLPAPGPRSRTEEQRVASQRHVSPPSSPSFRRL